MHKNDNKGHQWGNELTFSRVFTWYLLQGLFCDNSKIYLALYNQINARALIGQSAIVCASKLMKKLLVFWIIT